MYDSDFIIFFMILYRQIFDSNQNNTALKIKQAELILVFIK
jgi:hypothetical protein